MVHACNPSDEEVGTGKSLPRGGLPGLAYMVSPKPVRKAVSQDMVNLPKKSNPGLRIHACTHTHEPAKT